MNALLGHIVRDPARLCIICIHQQCLACSLLTDGIDGGEAVAEAAGRAAGEVDPVGRVVGPCHGHDEVVVAVVHERVPEDEVARHLRRRPRRRRRRDEHGQGTHDDHLPRARAPPHF